MYRGDETSGRPAVAVAGGGDFEHPAKGSGGARRVVRTREAARSAPSGAGLSLRFLASAAGCRGPRPGPGRERRRVAAVGESEKKREEERDERQPPSHGRSRGARQAGARAPLLALLPPLSRRDPSLKGLWAARCARTSARAAAESVQRARGESALTSAGAVR